MRNVLLLPVLSCLALFATDPAALDVKTVYVLRMANGLDQYLASELTKSGVYAVTTDAQKADAIFTDALGEGFEKKFDELYPPPPPPKAEEDAAKKDSGPTEAPMERLGNSAWGRGKGTVFLVERSSRRLLWSMNRQPRNSSTKEIVEQARKVVQQLQKDLGAAASK